MTFKLKSMAMALAMTSAFTMSAAWGMDQDDEETIQTKQGSGTIIFEGTSDILKLEITQLKEKAGSNSNFKKPKITILGEENYFAKYDELKPKYDVLEEKYDELQQKYNQLETTKSQEIKKLNQDHSQEIKKLNQDHIELKNLNKDINTLLEKARKTIAGHEDQITALTTKNKQLVDEKDKREKEFSARIGELTSKNVTLEKSKDELVDQHAKQIQEMEAKSNKLEKENALLQSQIEQLKQENEMLKNPKPD